MPSEVGGVTFQPKNDPRFKEVEASRSFILNFSSGLIATSNAGYAAHRSQFFRLEGENGWAELSPAFCYSGLKLRPGTFDGTENLISEPLIESTD